MVKNAFGILVSRFKVLLTTMEQRPKVVRDVVVTCIVLHNMLRSHQKAAERPPTPSNDIQVPKNDKAKRQRDLLKDYFNHLGGLDGQEDRI